ncbi:MAG: transposase [Atopobiaceae bacterium]|nr:transposase [Atopobiaceae bacterium]
MRHRHQHAQGAEGRRRDGHRQALQGPGGAICEHPDSEVEELVERPLGALRMPCLRIGATYVKRRRDRRVASTAVVTAIGCDGDSWRRVPGLGVVDTEGYDSWPAFLRRIRARGVAGVMLVTSDAHEGLRRAIEEVFQGSAWQRCVVHLMRDRARAASGSRSLQRRVSTVVWVRTFDRPSRNSVSTASWPPWNAFR